jgi:urate oxidase/2-oxo-4-hydroxy-4-carboxy-5-ureidoimidazoline decarboxylase
VEQFASGWKRSYYGKGDVIAYRLNRDGKAPGEQSPVFGASVLMLVYGDAFWRTYTEGDNTGLVATDSMKNFIQRETMNYAGDDLAEYCHFLAETFIGKYPQVEGVQVSAVEIPYESVNGQAAFAPAGPERAIARIELSRTVRRPPDAGVQVVEATSGIRGFKLLRLGGSAFHGFVRDEYTTLPDIHNRPLHMWLDVEWRYNAPGAPADPVRGTSPQAVRADPRSGRGDVPANDVARVREIVRDVFAAFESGSIQQVIYQMGTRVLAELPAIQEVHLEADNRTWDTIAERGDELGVYTDARPPYGCLGLRLTR